MRVLLDANILFSATKSDGAVRALVKVLDERAEDDGVHFRVRGEAQAIKALREQLG